MRWDESVGWVGVECMTWWMEKLWSDVDVDIE